MNVMPVYLEGRSSSADAHLAEARDQNSRNGILGITIYMVTIKAILPEGEDSFFNG